MLSIDTSIHLHIHLFIHSLYMYMYVYLFIHRKSIFFSPLNTNQISTDVYFPWFWNVTQTWDMRLSLLQNKTMFSSLSTPFSHFVPLISAGRLFLYLLQLISTHDLKMTDSLLEVALTMGMVHSTTNVSPMEYPAMNRVISGIWNAYQLCVPYRFRE